MLLASLIPPISPTFTGVLVGAVTGALAFMTVALVLVRRRARQALETREVVTVPPYVVLPQRAGVPFFPPDAADADDVALDGVSTRAFRRPRGFSPQLSARALARMGVPVGPFGQRLELALDERDELDEDGLEVDVSEFAPPAVTVAPCIIVSESTSRAPHPLGVIAASSLAMKAALSDDSPTEIGETFFDVAPRPPAPPVRPKIRPIPPSAPRFAG